MTNLYVYIKNYIGENITDDKTLAKIKRRKFTIDRENILKSTEKLIKEIGTYKGFIEFDYYNEVGSGIGPTLEFYSVFF
jgi:E3 ubiquitin-protein ligase TRIP12